MTNPLQFGFHGVLRVVDGLLCLDAGESGVVPLLKGGGMRRLLTSVGLPIDTELSGEQASVVVIIHGVTLPESL